MTIKTTSSDNRRRPRVVPPHAAQLAAFALFASPGLTLAQETAPPATPPAVSAQGGPAQTADGGATSGSPPSAASAPPLAAEAHPNAAPTGPPPLEINFHGPTRLEEGSIIHQTGGVDVTYLGTTLSSDRLDGDLNRELIFSGHARIQHEGIDAEADAIHFFPQDGSYRLDNPHGVLSPSLFQGNIYDPVFVSGGILTGTQAGYILAENIVATTCRERTHHYQLEIRNAELFPHKRIVLRRVGFYLFGVKLITIPELVIPLDQRAQRRPRTDYLPEFGQNLNEGYYARFPYEFAEGAVAATFLRADLTQKLGPGYRIEQSYLAGKQTSQYSTSGYSGGGGFTPGANGSYLSAYGYGTIGAQLPRFETGIGPANGGLFSMQGYFGSGFDKNFNASFRHQQNIGSSNRISFDTELQRNSFFVTSGSVPTSTAQTTSFDFAHNDAAHGVADDLSLNLTTNNSTGYSNRQITGSLKQAYQFASSGTTRNSLTLDLNLSHLLQTSSGSFGNSTTRSELLDSQFQFQHVSSDYTLTLDANKTTPIGFQSSNSVIGTTENLPELLVSTDTYNYRGGWLRHLPATFQLGVGEYSEPSNNITTDRVLLAFNTQPLSILRGRTELRTTAGFEQRIYGDGAALYVVHDSTDLRQHLGGRSGFDINYVYEQPEGGTPFTFDQPRQSHAITLQGGYLNDPRFQFAAQVGYDLLGSQSADPWQSLSTRLMWRPSSNLRFDATQVYNPNTGKFFNFVNEMRLRGNNDLALDLVALIDPNQLGIRRKFTAINTQFDIPIGRSWRLSGLLRYSGLSGQFESRNIQIVHDWDCMEASLTYTENIGGFRPDRQIYLAIRIKAFPFFRAFNRGPAGEAIGTGIGSIY